MNYKIVAKFNAQILLMEALFMIPALILCLVDGEIKDAWSFLAAIAAICAVAGILLVFSRGAKNVFYARDGLVCVSLGWILISLLGCLPFYLSGAMDQFVDALFEMVSGFTTTGASILKEVESLSHGILYWRSFSHWLGGMGVLVFLLAIVPGRQSSNGFSVHLLRAESPGPNVSKLVPKTRQTATILYAIYIALTVLDFLFLLLGGMPAFDALCTAFGTAGTGGFGIKNDSIAGYSTYIQNVCTVFMFLFGVNFSCYFLLLIRQFKAVFTDEELWLYLGVTVGSIAAIALDIRSLYPTFGETWRHAAFQVVSIMTTTGFATTNFDIWPTFSKSLLLCLMVIGACAGSTGGGIKCARVLLLLKGLRRNISQALHPRRVQSIRINKQVVDNRVLDNTNTYLAAYVVIVFVSFLILSLDGFSITTCFSAVLACFNNIGPGLEIVGPTSNYSAFGALSKMVLILDMLAGRLEIFPMLVLFNRKAWSRA